MPLVQGYPASGGGGFAPPPTGGTIFVSPTGSDFAAGTETNPFRTINKAASVVNPDDVVVVEDGIWTDTHSTLGDPSNPSIVELGRGGVAGHPVTFKARNYLGAKLDGQNGNASQGFNFRSGAGFIRIQGFDIYGVASTTSSCAGIDTFGGGHDSVIALCDIHDCGRICIVHGFGQNGIFVGSVNVTVEKTKIHNIGRLAPTEGCSPAGPYQTNDHGIYYSNGDNLLVRSCIFYLNQRGWSIQVYPTARSGMKILNSTFAFGNPFQNQTHMVLDAPISNSLIANCIFYDTVLGAALKAFGSNSAFSNFTVRNNLAVSTQMTDPASPAGITFIANLTGVNPQLVNPPTDFHVFPGSPAINAGFTTADVTEDFDGVPRPQGIGYDIGAYER